MRCYLEVELEMYVFDLNEKDILLILQRTGRQYRGP